MKLQLYLSVLLLAITSVFANPIEDLVKRDLVARQTNTTAGAGGSNSTAGGGGAVSNNTAGGAGSTNGTSSQQGKWCVLVLGGDPTITNSSMKQEVEVRHLMNSSAPLNVTQLYHAATIANQTLTSNQYKGLVLVANGNSLEALGFFGAVLYDTKKPVVVTSQAQRGLNAVSDPGAMKQGSLVVAENNLVYSAIFAPKYVGSSVKGGVPIGAVGNDAPQVYWFFNSTQPALISNGSLIRTQYANFTNPRAVGNSSSSSSGPIVPIIYQSDFSSQLIQGLGSNVQGVVVVTNEVEFTNSTVAASSSSSGSSSSVPIVFAAPGAPIGFVGANDVPQGSIAAGYLSPVKAQLLLSIALANGVNGQQELQQIFPSTQSSTGAGMVASNMTSSSPTSAGNSTYSQ